MSFFAMLWDLARSVNDTDSFAHGGYKLASRLIRKDANLIDTLADKLSVAITISGEQLHSWLDDHAGALDLDDLELSAAF
jgi:hypothetical protein